MGRADEVTKIKGMFVHPRQIDEAAARFPQEVERMKVLVTREGTADIMTAEILLKDGVAETEALKAAIEAGIRESTKLRANAVFVREIPAGSKMIEDKRQWQ
jgi:phenylacetate-CoA ligase